MWRPLGILFAFILLLPALALPSQGHDRMEVHGEAWATLSVDEEDMVEMVLQVPNVPELIVYVSLMQDDPLFDHHCVECGDTTASGSGKLSVFSYNRVTGQMYSKLRIPAEKTGIWKHPQPGELKIGLQGNPEYSGPVKVMLLEETTPAAASTQSLPLLPIVILLVATGVIWYGVRSRRSGCARTTGRSMAEETTGEAATEVPDGHAIPGSKWSVRDRWAR